MRTNDDESPPQPPTNRMRMSDAQRSPKGALRTTYGDARGLRSRPVVDTKNGCGLAAVRFIRCTFDSSGELRKRRTAHWGADAFALRQQPRGG